MYDFGHSKPEDFNYLGYRFIFTSTDDKKQSRLRLGLSDNRMDKYRKRIRHSLASFQKKSDMIRNIKFLTGNTRLKNNKKDVLVGIYFSNRELTYYEDLCYLDKYKNKLIKQDHIPEGVKKCLREFSFKNGFEEKIYSKFNFYQLQRAMASLRFSSISKTDI